MLNNRATENSKNFFIVIRFFVFGYKKGKIFVGNMVVELWLEGEGRG
jgi:hypothetical protein